VSSGTYVTERSGDTRYTLARSGSQGLQSFLLQPSIGAQESDAGSKSSVLSLNDGWLPVLTSQFFRHVS
jgi:hypothetical protein